MAAACGHIDALAKAAKHTGDSRPIDHIRADLFLGMTDGTYAGLDVTTILERLRATSHHDSGTRGNDDEADQKESGEDTALDNEGEAEYRESGNDGVAELDGAAVGDAGCAAAGDPVGPGGRGAGMELRARMSTLLGRDEYPGELAGWGPVHAGLTRNLAILMARGEWRFAITDAHGQLLHGGIVRARPTGLARRSAASREIVKLQIPAAALGELVSDPDALGTWRPVITDLARQYASGLQPRGGDPTRRSPDAVLRRYLQIRDRRCVMIGCRFPARGADADHTRGPRARWGHRRVPSRSCLSA